MVIILTALAVAAKKLAIYLAKKLAKKKAMETAKRNKLLIFATITAIFLSIFFVVVFVISMFSNPLCSFSENFCEEGEESIVQVSDIRTASERGTQLRYDTNNGATIRGDNFREYQIRPNWKEGSEEEQDAEGKTGAILAPGESLDINPAEWLTGNWQGINEGFAIRLARFARDNNRKLDVYSGMRSLAEQWRLWNCWQAREPGCNMAAYPGTSDHGVGMAVDVTGWPKFVSEAEHEPYGLCRPLLHHPENPEDWHYVPCESVGVKDKANLVIDGYGGNYVKGDTASELLVYWLSMRQADLFGMTASDSALKVEMEKDTNLGRTYKVALEMQKQFENGTYNNKALLDRAKDSNYTISDYMELTRFEVQKCFLIGDEKIGFWENVFGSETPCADLDKLLGKQMIPSELQGVIAKTEEAQVCVMFGDDGSCETYNTQTTVVYKTVKEIVYMYQKVGIFGNEDAEDYREYIDMVIKELFEATLVGGFDGAATMPDYIVPFEDKTYKTIAKFGQKDDGDILKGIIVTSSAKINGVYATSGGEVVRAGTDMILIKHSTGYYSQYEGFKSNYSKVGDIMGQGQMIASFGNPDKVLFSICKEIAGTGKSSECIGNIDPEGPPAMLAFSFQEDVARITELEAEWSKLVAKIGSEAVFMPGFSALGNLGSLSAWYETTEKYPGEKSGLCVHHASDVHGGMSCGSYQIATNPGTMREYLNFAQKKYPQYFNQLSGVPLVIGSYGPAWKRVWEGDKQGFYHSQHDFIAETHYLPIKNRLEKELGLNFSHRHPVILDVIWSFAVHHRNNTVIAFKEAGLDNTMSDAEFITKAYDRRIQKWPDLTPRFVNEKADALARLR